MCFEPTFSTPDTFHCFEVQILTEIYDKTTINRTIRKNSAFSLYDFMPFLKFQVVEGHVVVVINKICDWLPVLKLFCS